MTSPLTQLSEDEQLFKSMVSDFAQKSLKPHVIEMDQNSAFKPEIVKQFFDLDIMGIEIPEAYGGAESTFFMSILAVEALSVVDASAGVLVDVQNTLVNNALKRWANEDQKQRYLTKLASEWVGAYALSEAGSGSDAFGLACTAKEEGDNYILNGRKLWITNGNEANLFIVFATIDKGLGYKGITAFLVERGFDGFSVGKKEDKLGIRASSTCELILDNCRVPKENILGEVGKGYKVAIETLNEGRIGIGAQMVGVAQGALDAAIKYANEREQFGKSISKFQAVQFKLAELATEVEAARLMTYNCARLKDAGIDFVKEAAMCKYFTSTVAEKVASQALEIFGGYGYTKEYPAEKFYRDVKIGKIYEGTSHMQLQTIAKIILG
ncbi:MAG: acyl-CoA dehydrogenase [Candidatus Sericytochromatia bacterium]|nr:acyl-CoA dehydrogenase [Candidatus Sericytochromatia bacterium]